MKFGIPISINVALWSIVGIMRYIDDRRRAARRRESGEHVMTAEKFEEERGKVAVLLPCYNEEIIVTKAIESLKQLVPADQIFVAADGCTDRTADIARGENCQVLELNPGRGKARALEALIEHFGILDVYSYVLMADADAIFGPNYLKNALAIFARDPEVSAVAGYARTPWRKHYVPNTRMFYMGYRVRLYRVLQWLLVYGWSWRYTNVQPVVPGFASIYRSNVLHQLDIYVPGMVIEDFNLAFQIHKKKLGRVAHHPSVYAIDQDPDNLADYMRQVERWNVGYWQTVKHNGFWPSKFWLAQGFFVLEVVAFAITLLILPVIIIGMTLAYKPAMTEVLFTMGAFKFTMFHFAIVGIYFGIFVVDYFMTVIVALRDRRYMLLFYGLGFIFIRVIDSMILLMSIFKGFRKSESVGRWTPPTRYEQVDEA